MPNVLCVCVICLCIAYVFHKLRRAIMKPLIHATIHEFSKSLYQREEKVKTIVDDVMEKMPEQFNMPEIMAKVEERTPYVIVCFQVKH